METGFPYLAQPAQRALAGADIKSLKDLVGRTEAEIVQLHGMGPNAVAKLKAAMQEQGLSFAPPR